MKINSSKQNKQNQTKPNQNFDSSETANQLKSHEQYQSVDAQPLTENLAF